MAEKRRISMEVFFDPLTISDHPGVELAQNRPKQRGYDPFLLPGPAKFLCKGLQNRSKNGQKMQRFD